MTTRPLTAPMLQSPQHHIIKDCSDTLSHLLTQEFKRNGYKRVHIVEKAPKPEEIEGKLPAVSVYLYQMSIDPEGHSSTPHSEIVEVPQPDGTMKEFMRKRRMWVRLDYLMSAWAQTPEDEQLLLGLTIRTIMENPALTGTQLKGSSWPEDDFELYPALSARLDEGTLARFWGSLNQPIRPAVQTWTAVPILPSKLEEFKRVHTRELTYKSITDPRVNETGPSGNPFLAAKRLDLGGAPEPKPGGSGKK